MVLHTVSGGGYDNVSMADVGVTVLDDDIAGVTVSEMALSVEENGGVATYTLVLDTEPLGEVTITPRSSDNTVATVSPTNLRFTAGNWRTAQTVMVIGVNNDIDHPVDQTATVLHTISGGGYENVSIADVGVTVLDDDTAGITVSETALSVDENGGVGTYTLVLDTEPLGEVTITPRSSDETVATVSPTNLRFTAGNWRTAQTVTVIGVNNDIDHPVDQTATVLHTVSGGGYENVSIADVGVTVLDDDTAGIIVSEMALSVDENGGVGTYTLVLDTEPTGEVTITPRSSDETVAIVSPTNLRFTAGNWRTAQIVTVIGVNNDIDHPVDQTATVLHTVSGGGYENVSIADVGVTVLDDDIAGVTVSETALLVDENGGVGTYTLVLDTEPLGEVTITPRSSDKTVATVSPTNLRFTAGNWRTAQTVTVIGVNNDIDHPVDQTATVLHTVSGGGYENVSIADVGVTVLDDDIAGVTVSETALSVDENGGVGTYTLVLDTEPLGEVTITPRSSDETVAIVSPTNLRFTAGNWRTAQIVTVIGVNDDALNNFRRPRSATISHSVSGGGYEKVSVVNVEVTLIDDETLSQRLDNVILSKIIGQVTTATTTAITSRLDATAAGQEASPIHIEDVVSNAVEFLWSQGEMLNSGDLQWENVFSGRSFAVPLSSLWQRNSQEAGASEQGSIVLWGNTDYTVYENIIDGVDFEGSTFSSHIGFDLQPRVDLVVGYALAFSSSTFDYMDMTESESIGTYNVRIASVNPYIGYTASEQLRIWGSVGYGWGEREIKPDGETAIMDQSEWKSLMGGMRFELWSADAAKQRGSSPLSLAMKADVGAAQFLDIAVQQARLAVEASHSFAVDSGELTTAIELGLRLRSEESAGLEMGSHFSYQDMASGFSTTVRGRLLLAGDGPVSQWGVGGNISYGPGDDGEGLSIVLEPSIGNTSSTLADLWSLDDMQVSLAGEMPEAVLRAELGYGFPTGSGLLTPYSAVRLSEGGGSTVGLGLRYGLPAGMDVDLKGEQERSGNGRVNHRVGLQLQTPL